MFDVIDYQLKCRRRLLRKMWHHVSPRRRDLSRRRSGVPDMYETQVVGVDRARPRQRSGGDLSLAGQRPDTRQSLESAKSRPVADGQTTSKNVLRKLRPLNAERPGGEIRAVLKVSTELSWTRTWGMAHAAQAI